jgi:spore coat polysaccharide biosynthesis predicted glycosyltransferase SpsG/RimJ/RimL family protein N-acetyltransferase
MDRRLTIALRCDGDERVGAGHVGRCLPIALALRRAGQDATFVGTYGGVAQRLLAAAQLRTTPAAATPAGLPDGAGAALIDHYDVDDDEVAAAAAARPVVAVRDVRTPHALGAARALDYHLDAAGDGLLGPDFAPVDPRFVAARRPARASGRALVALGGSHAGAVVLPALVRGLLDATDLRVDVAGGLVPEPHPRVRSVGSLPGLAGELAACDVLVCGAGVTAYEAACAGVPAVLVVLADNQRRVADGFATAGLFAVLDAQRPLEAAAVTRAVAAARAAAAPRVGPALVDGYGAARVRDALLALAHDRPAPEVQRYRPARDADADLLLAWRNDPSVRAVSHATHEVAPAEHAAWLERVLADPDRALLVVEREGRPVGTVRFDREGAEATISVTVAPEQRGRGVGVRAIRESTELELAARPQLDRVVALVKAENAASQRAFERAGYVRSGLRGASLAYCAVR